MKTLACFVVFGSLLAGMSNCGKNYTVNSDGSSPDIGTIMSTYLTTDPIFDWAVHSPDLVLFQNEDALVVPEEIEAHKAEIHIRAFKNKFHRLIDSTWVLGYVSAKTKRGHEQLPGPTIEATNDTPTQITWVNQLEKTLQRNDDYNFPRKGLKYYPLVYNTKTLEESKADLLNANLSASIPMMVQAIYPVHFDPAQDTTHQHGGAIMFNSTYYSTTVHLHGANLAWKNDGYTASSIVESAGDTPQFTNYGLFGPYEQNKKKVTSHYTNTFEEAYDPSDLTRGRHGAIL